MGCAQGGVKFRVGGCGSSEGADHCKGGLGGEKDQAEGERKVGLHAQTLGQVHADSARKAVYALRPAYSLGLEFKDTFL